MSPFDTFMEMSDNRLNGLGVRIFSISQAMTRLESDGKFAEPEWQELADELDEVYDRFCSAKFEREAYLRARGFDPKDWHDEWIHA